MDADDPLIGDYQFQPEQPSDIPLTITGTPPRLPTLPVIIGAPLVRCGNCGFAPLDQNALGEVCERCGADGYRLDLLADTARRHPSGGA